MAERVFLDACVLFPPLVRTLLTGAAEAGLFLPLWSARVLEEWRIAALGRGAGERDLERTINALVAAFPGAMVPGAEDREGAFHLPDPADAHVAAAAEAAGAPTIVTFNLRDFPARALAAHGLEARHPDGFLWEHLSKSPETFGARIRQAGEAFSLAGPPEMRRALKRAHLPRLGKAWEAVASA